MHPMRKPSMYIEVAKAIFHFPVQELMSHYNIKLPVKSPIMAFVVGDVRKSIHADIIAPGLS